MTARLDASTLRRCMALFRDALRRHRAELNSLNVYPVPDGDTGTNMLLTQEAVEEALAALDGRRSSLRSLGETIARASLMGARGNSGVILSQVLRGLAERLPADEDVGPRQLADALQHAAEEAVRAVARPAEGTVLTVLRDAAAAGREAAEAGVDTDALAGAVLEAARDSLARTRDLLPELREAGVVDAGAKGIVLLFDALRAALTGAPLTEAVGPPGPVGADGGWRTPPGQPELRFEVQYLLQADDASVPALRQGLSELGDSVVVVGGGGLYNVHVHTNQPGGAVELGVEAGRPRDISLVDLREQVVECIGGQARAVRVAEQACGLVAVVDGAGLAATLRSLGAVVVPGGPGNNPSVAEIARAIEAAPGDEVVVLPNHRNVVPAAERAAKHAGKRVHVVPTRSVPEGIAAATAFNPTNPLHENVEPMTAAAAATRAGEIARAERDAPSPAGPVAAGDWVGMGEEGVVAVGPSASEVAVALVRWLAGEGAPEIVTLVAGEGAAPSEIREVAGAVEEAFPELAVEVVQGDQPRYPYLIGVE